jgi:glycosyltransferase involved in cell wall biosynthesis
MKDDRRRMCSISVIICTYNRCLLLDQTLQSLLSMRVAAGLDWEVLVVDNNSSDRTRETVEAYHGRLPVQYIHEPRQGKTYALNHGVGAARGELLLFTDDDVQLDPEWLTRYADAAERHPQAGWFGGRIFLNWERGRPLWLHEECLPPLAGYFGLYDLGAEERGYVPEDLPPAGANMAVRRGTFHQIGGYREDLGPRGASKGTCDDSELIWRAQNHSLAGVYVAGATCRHFVPHDRLAHAWFFRYGIGKGRNQGRLPGAKHSPGSLLRAIAQAARAMPQMLRGRWDRVRICCLNMGIEIGRWQSRTTTA